MAGGCVVEVAVLCRDINTATWLEMYQTVFYAGGALKRWLVQQYDCSQKDFHVKIIKARYLSCLFMFK